MDQWWMAPAGAAITAAVGFFIWLGRQLVAEWRANRERDDDDHLRDAQLETLVDFLREVQKDNPEGSLPPGVRAVLRDFRRRERRIESRNPDHRDRG